MLSGLLLILAPTLTAPSLAATPADVAPAPIFAQEAAEQKTDEFSSAEAGFKIKLPSKDWVMNSAPGDHGISALAMGPPALGGLVQFSVQISASSAKDLAAMAVSRDDLMEQVKSIDGIRDCKPIEMKVAGLLVPGLELEQDAMGQTFFVRQAYLLSQGLEYKFQVHAPKDQFEEHNKLFQAAFESFEVVPLAGEAVAQAKLRELANRCGSEVEFYDDWDKVATDARKEKKLILVTVNAVPGFEIGDQFKRGIFMDLDIVRLANSRFKVLQWRRGMGAPFEAQDRFGMGPSTFGTGMLVVTPDADVVRQVFLLESTAVYDQLIDVLSGHPQISVPTPPADADRWHSIQFLLHTGQLEKARAMLSEVDDTAKDPQEWWLHFEYNRLKRNGSKAMESLMNSNKSGQKLAGPISEARFYLDFINLFVVTGQPDTAAMHLGQLMEWPNQPKEIARELPSDLMAEALLMKGALRLQAEDRAGCEEAWLKLATDYPESRWAWMAAAFMTGPGWKVDIWPDLRWPDQKDRRFAFMPKPANAATSASVDELIEGAADHLLNSQLLDGSWAAISSYNDRKKLADDFELAATAISGRALLRLNKGEKTKWAAKNALAWILRQREVRQKEEVPPVVFMDYAVWSRSYMIYFLADCIDAEIGDAKLVRAEIKNCLNDLAERQQSNGGWSYYLSTQVGGQAAAQSISFTSATVVKAWQRAQDVGVEFDQEILDRGLACMEALRSDEGTFAYFLNGADINTASPASMGVEGSAARGPSCALSLIRGGREDWEQMVPRMEMYADKLATFGKQHHKALMHAGPAAQGSHYLLYDYSTGAEALREGWQHLPEKLRSKVQKTILRELRLCLNADGSFVDNPLMGTDTCTGLALNTLLDLKDLK